ncbi:MAG: helix-turn-helix transcriptional regulator [Treponema sp.]|nr:helix-turn-helix transcriptional regulator [Treponema sp.]
MEIKAILSGNLRKYRKEARLTQEKLAEICGTDHRYIGQIETGTRCPSLEFIEKIASALNIKPYLLFYDGNNNGTDEIATLNFEQKQQLKTMLFDNFSKICNAIDGRN